MSSFEALDEVELTTTYFYVLHEPSEPGERVLLTGDAVALLCGAPMATSELNSSLWSCAVALPAKRPVVFRFEVESAAGVRVPEAHERHCTPRGVEFHISNGALHTADRAPSVWSEHDVVRAGELQVRLMIGGVTLPFDSCCTDESGCLLPVLRLHDATATPTHVELESNADGEPLSRVSLEHVLEKQTDIVYHTRRSLLDVQLELRVCAGDEVVGSCYVLGGAMRGGAGFLHLALVKGGGETPVRVVGDATLYFLVIHGYTGPASGGPPPDCGLVARTLWKSSPSEDVGHRGSGAHGARGKRGTRTWLAENTILSFNNAARNQLPFIEFDVQLTSDNVPVIWHDFHINDDNGLPLQIGDLTLKQFRNFRKHEQHHHHRHHHHRHHHSHRQKGEHHLRAKEKVSAGADLAHVPNGVPSSAPRSASGGIARAATSALVLTDDGDAIDLAATTTTVSRTSSGSDDIDVMDGRQESPPEALPKRRATRAGDDDDLAKIKHKASDGGVVIADKLTSLRDVFEHTPRSLGFDIECKYPMIDDERKGVRFRERNAFVDAVLNVVFAYADQPRRIFFSSFDPDVCIMLHMKQTRYPVFFLTESGSVDCNKYDVRTASLDGAVRFARRRNLFGVISRVTPLLNDPTQIDFVKTSGLLLGTFGGENNELENVQLQEEKHVDLIVSDHMATNESRKTLMRERAERLERDSVFV